MHKSAEIEGGYLLLARAIADSYLMAKPPLYIKLWIWMLCKANFKDRDKLKRGQLVTSIKQMQQAMSYYIGYRKITPSRDEIRAAYGYFSGHHEKGNEGHALPPAITITKTTRGMVITICNYSIYQNQKNYDTHRQSLDDRTVKPTATPHDTERIIKNEKYNPVPVIEYLNKKAGRRFKDSTAANRKLIIARMNEGYSLEDFKVAIDNQCRVWLGTDRAQFLRPETLFGSKFDGYLNNVPLIKSDIQQTKLTDEEKAFHEETLRLEKQNNAQRPS